MMGNFINSCSKGAVFYQHRRWVGLSVTGVVGRGREFFMSYSPSIRLGFSAIEPISKLVKVETKMQYLCLVGRLQPCSGQVPPTKTRYPPDRTPDTRLCPCLVRLHAKVFHPASPMSPAGCGYSKLALDDCSKILAFEKTTSSRLPEKTL